MVAATVGTVVVAVAVVIGPLVVEALGPRAKEESTATPAESDQTGERPEPGLMLEVARERLQTGLNLVDTLDAKLGAR